MASGSTEHLTKAQEYWVKVFTESPYTNLLLADYLVQKSSLSWSDILKNPEALIERITDNQLEADSFTRIWWGAGRCTSLAVQVAGHLQEYNSLAFDFEFYDLKGHRVARCLKTEILIDSGSTVGALVLKDGENWAIQRGENKPEWKWDAGASRFQAEWQGSKVTGNAVTAEICMARCLIAVRDRFLPICLFRSFGDGRAQYHGLIKWIPAQKQLLLINDIKTRGITTIAFGSLGTQMTEQQSIIVIKNFIAQRGGLDGEKQWKFGQPEHTAEDVHNKIWDAAKIIWGLPYIED